MVFAKVETFHKGSQFGQDKIILDILNKKTNGYFLDIGAADGELINNTLILEKEYNWNGLSVDPFPMNFDNRKTKVAREVIFNGNEVEFTCGDFLGGVTETLGTHKERIKTANTIKLKSITPRELLIKYEVPREIDFLSLDTEGSEYEILKLFPFEEYKIKTILVEHNNEFLKQDRIYELLTSKGYQRLYTLAIDDIYCINDE